MAENNVNNNNSFEKILPHHRLKYLISKYFVTQTDFSTKAEIGVQLVNKYVKGTTKRISITQLMKIEANVGFSSDFIQNGTGPELISGCKLKPQIEINNPIIAKTEQEISAGKNLKIGIINKVSITKWGKEVRVCDHATANILDGILNGLEKSLMIEINAEDFNDFFVKYDIKNNSKLIIEEGRCEYGDIVFVICKQRLYLCEYLNGELIDIDNNVKTREDINIKDADIKGAVYSEFRKFKKV